MIVGIGVDVVEIARIQIIMNDKPTAFVQRILAAQEREALDKITNAQRRSEYMAGRFAAKEAVAKALGTGIGAASFTEIITTKDELGKPGISFLGRTQELAHSLGVAKAWLSISHTETIAMAYVILEA